MATVPGIADQSMLPGSILPARENSKSARYGWSGPGWYMIYDFGEEGFDGVIFYAPVTVQPPFRVELPIEYHR